MRGSWFVSLRYSLYFVFRIVAMHPTFLGRLFSGEAPQSPHPYCGSGIKKGGFG